ncbi:MAG: SCP2 sterol-binding domain-containing protein [Anaerolineaceae bacterium]
MHTYTIDDLIALIPSSIDPLTNEKINGVIQIAATGQFGGEWVITINNNQCQVCEGLHESPDIIITAEAKDAIAIFSGEKNVVTEYMQGKIHFTGSMGLAMKLFKIFSLYRSTEKINKAPKID